MRLLTFILICVFIYPAVCFGQEIFLDPLDKERFIPSTSWLTYVISILTIPILYLIFVALKNMIFIAWNSDKEEVDNVIENAKVLTKGQKRNKMVVRFINKFFEALIFVGITILLLFVDFYYIIYEKWYYIDDDLFALGWFLTPIWVVFQDFIVVGFKKSRRWYKENSKL